MAVAKIYPEPARGRGKKDPAKGSEAVSFTRIKEARAVLRFAPDLADNVLSGKTPLDTAYQTARQRKDAAATGEKI